MIHVAAKRVVLLQRRIELSYTFLSAVLYSGRCVEVRTSYGYAF